MSGSFLLYPFNKSGKETQKYILINDHGIWGFVFTSFLFKLHSPWFIHFYFLNVWYVFQFTAGHYMKNGLYGLFSFFPWSKNAYCPLPSFLFRNHCRFCSPLKGLLVVSWRPFEISGIMKAILNLKWWGLFFGPYSKSRNKRLLLTLK